MTETGAECDLIGRNRFILAYVHTSREACEEGDIKKPHAQARHGELPGFTGIDHPYEEPARSRSRADETPLLTNDNARRVIAYLIQRSFLKNAAGRRHVLAADAGSPIQPVSEVS
jgi:adenylylsulfate kinase